MRAYREAMEWIYDPKNRDVAISMDGMRTVLDLRNRFGQPATKLTDPQKYVELELHRKALPPKLKSGRNPGG